MHCISGNSSEEEYTLHASGSEADSMNDISESEKRKWLGYKISVARQWCFIDTTSIL